MQNQTILFGKLNPRILKVWLVDSESENRKIASTEFIPLRTTDKAVPQFIYYLCQSRFVVPIAKTLVSGSTPSRQRVDISSFSKIQIPLPSLPEQRAIAHVLQTVQNAIQARRKELEFERERKAALMEHLFTHGTRNEPTKMSKVGEVPESWEVHKLGEAILDIQYGLSLAGKSTGTYPILRMNNLTDGLVIYDDLQYVDLDNTVFQRFKLNKGDLLFNRTNSADLVGKTSLFDVDLPAVFASYLIRIVTDSKLLRPGFLNWYFNWDVVQSRLKTLASRGVSQSNISASNLQNFRLPIPTISEQAEIANIFNTITTKIAALEKEITLQEELFRVLLDELMTGRLSTRALLEGEERLEEPHRQIRESNQTV